VRACNGVEPLYLDPNMSGKSIFDVKYDRGFGAILGYCEAS
jgi:hypothetical protein